jgi:hypothetical protein
MGFLTTVARSFATRSHGQGMVKQTFTADGYKNLFSYDRQLGGIYGYWLCKRCAIPSQSLGNLRHRSLCPVGRTIGILNENVIYVFGPQGTGASSPFAWSQVAKIKEQMLKKT